MKKGAFEKVESDILAHVQRGHLQSAAVLVEVLKARVINDFVLLAEFLFSEVDLSELDLGVLTRQVKKGNDEGATEIDPTAPVDDPSRTLDETSGITQADVRAALGKEPNPHEGGTT